ncbi:MAG TPA: ATP-binding protein [Polyangia bacterium]|nr:ATP-binding protein [Polyangia bacterium]
MRLFYKIALVLVAAATVPLATVGFALVARNQRALEAEVRARFDETARHAAEAVAADVEGRARQLAQTAAMIGWDKLSLEEAAGALALVRRQARAQTAIYFRGAEEVAPGDETLNRALREHAPRERARKEGAGAVVFSTPYGAAGGRAIAAALAVPGGEIALEIPVSVESARLDEVRGDQPAAVTLVDDSGGEIALAKNSRAPSRSVLADALRGKDGHARRYVTDGETTVAAFAPVGGLGWSVVVEEDAERAFAAPRAMRRLTLLWAGGAALLAVGLAFLFARRLTAALERLSQAARALGRGQLDARVDVDSSDEVGALAETFNKMGGELQASRAEIESWNHELEARVEARTRELKDAQAQLVQAQKLAALGQLGAGVAHEINNPLGGVIGHVQLLLADRDQKDRDYEALTCIETAARQASQVVQNLLRFSVQHKDPVRTSVDVNRLVRDTLSLTGSLLAEQKIALELELDKEVPRLRADAGQVGQVLLNLVSNARTAMPQGGKLRVATARKDGEVGLSVEDSGKGIPPEIRERIFEPFFTTKDEWSNVGLGLSVSYRIVSEHGGHIDVASEVGRGSTFTVWLPAT